MNRTRLAPWVLVACVSCHPGFISDPSRGEDAPADGASDPNAPGAPGAAGYGAPGYGTGDPQTATGYGDPTCDASEVRATDAPLRRLTPTEYVNTLRDLFAGVNLPALDLVDDAAPSQFDNDAERQVVSALHVERFRGASRAVAAAVATNRTWLPCDPAPNEAECGARIVEQLTYRAFRRPVDAAELERFATFFERARAVFGFDAALRMLVEVTLESTRFLYRPELAPLDDHAVASRLSYFLWETMPDDALFAAADRGELRTRAQIAAQASRLLADPRAKATVARFHRQWLRLDRLDALTLASSHFPEFDDAMRAALAASTERFVDYAFWEDGRFQSLMTSTVGFVNDAVAPVFGVPAPGSDTLVRVDLDGTRRAGLLTQPGVLASTSHPITHSPILRGVFVLDDILCAPSPAVPATVNAVIPQDGDEGTEGLTTRERVEQLHGTDTCAGCHNRIDGIGFAFEAYDALGRFRTEENGRAIDDTGTLLDTRDINGGFDGAVDLANRLATSKQAQACYAAQWFRFALGRTETRADLCQIEALVDALRASDGAIEAMLLELVTSPAFLSLPDA